MQVAEIKPQSEALPRRKPKRKRNRALKISSRYAGYCCLRLAHFLLSRLPLPLGLAVSRVGGYLAYLVAREARRCGVESLTRVYGNEFSENEIRQQVKEVFQHTAATAAEFCILRRWSNEKLQAKYPEVVAAVQQTERDVRASGSGVVGLTAHFGNWEVLSLFHSRFAPGLLVPVAKRAYFSKYHDFIHRLRTADGLEVIYNDESPRKLIRAIHDGKLLGLLPDQNLRTNGGVFVEFFGKPAYTVTFPVVLARKLGVKMFFSCLVREGGSFRLMHSGLFDTPRTGNQERDVLEGTQRWTSLLEDSIREFPTQWSWIYPRWRSTPDHPRFHHGGAREILEKPPKISRSAIEEARSAIEEEGRTAQSVW